MRHPSDFRAWHPFRIVAAGLLLLGLFLHPCSPEQAMALLWEEPVAFFLSGGPVPAILFALAMLFLVPGFAIPAWHRMHAAARHDRVPSRL